MTEAQQTQAVWRVALDPFLMLSALVALAFGFLPRDFFTQPNAPLFWLAAFKAAPAFLLSFRALIAQSRLLSIGLLFGCVGDALLVWPQTFAAGALAFLVGHLFYIALFLRAGSGLAKLREPARLAAVVGLIVAAVIMTWALVPRDSALFGALVVYTAVLTLVAIVSFTLPASRWLAMLGAVLFFISDGFVAWGRFHPPADATLEFWRGFAGWMIYWAGQAGICYGALGLHRAKG